MNEWKNVSLLQFIAYFAAVSNLILWFAFPSRFLSTLNYSVPLAANGTAVSKDESREFMSVFPGKRWVPMTFQCLCLFIPLIWFWFHLCAEFRFGSRFNRKNEEVWFQRCIFVVGSGKKSYTLSMPRRQLIGSFFLSQLFQALQYNVPRGKKNRGLATVQAYKSLVEDQTQLKPENVRLAHYLGWCIEMVRINSNFSISRTLAHFRIQREREFWLKFRVQLKKNRNEIPLRREWPVQIA